MVRRILFVPEEMHEERGSDDDARKDRGSNERGKEEAKESRALVSSYQEVKEPELGNDGR